MKKLSQIFLVFLLLTVSAFANDAIEVQLDQSHIYLDNYVPNGEKLNLNLKLIRDENSPERVTIHFNKNLYSHSYCARYGHNSTSGSRGMIMTGCAETVHVTRSISSKVKISTKNIELPEGNEEQVLNVSIKQTNTAINFFKRDYMKYSISNPDMKLKLGNKYTNSKAIYIYKK